MSISSSNPLEVLLNTLMCALVYMDFAHYNNCYEILPTIVLNTRLKSDNASQRLNTQVEYKGSLKNLSFKVRERIKECFVRRKCL